jgi:hypothetical protein
MPKDLGAWGTKAKRQLMGALKDAPSARFRETYVSSQDFGGTMLPTLCGKVNARNSYGGYPGFQRFIVSPHEVMIEDGTTGFSAIWDEACGWKLKILDR